MYDAEREAHNVTKDDLSIESRMVRALKERVKILLEQVPDACETLGENEAKAEPRMLEKHRIPTEAMLDAARDWSAKEFGRSIGNPAAIGCWQAMFDAD